MANACYNVIVMKNKKALWMICDITAADIINGMDDRLNPVCMKRATHVWQINLIEQPKLVVKFMPFLEACQHAENASLYQLIGLPTIDCTALQLKPAEILSAKIPGSLDGMLIMPFQEGTVLGRHKKTLLTEERDDLYSWFKENTLPQCIMLNHSDPNDENIIICEPRNDEDSDFIFIDPEYGLASAEEIPVIDLYKSLTTEYKRFPHFTTARFDKDLLARNTLDIVNQLQTTCLPSAQANMAIHVPRMIARGQELCNLLQRNKL